MAILVLCQDGPQAQALRVSAKQAHFDYIESILNDLLIAGPTNSEINENASGPYDSSCFIYHTNELKKAQELFFNDPYYKAGVYSSQKFLTFLPAAGEWIDGVIW